MHFGFQVIEPKRLGGAVRHDVKAATLVEHFRAIGRNLWVRDGLKIEYGARLE